MPRIPGISYRRAVRALEKVGFVVERETKHTVMVKDGIKVSIPRHNPVAAGTMGSIVRRAGLTVEEFRELL
ncbi:MAG: type II toxin-antitoxin system HicA family toxin [Chloroflexota bacterium]|nr:type II toxin-antitoxin system HicA family toxin [Chloroflexota bacterium]